MTDREILPKSWCIVPLSDVTSINPSKGTIETDRQSLAHFVPMACVTEEFGGIDVSTTRPLKEVVKGYTAFREGDVLFAKITPCMENGKIAVVPALEFGLGFGSTGFHVLRPSEVLLSMWIAHFLSQAALRRNAQRSMTGSAGQLRVPSLWLAEQIIPIPPINEQRRIVAEIEELFSDLDAGVSALKRAKANLKRYRAAVLKAAVEGKLTEEWRAKRPVKESASTLLSCILKERRQKWEADQLAKFAAAKKEPPKNWREKYVEPSPPDTAGLPELPGGWCWASVEQLAIRSEYGTSVKCDYDGDGPPVLRIPNIAAGEIDLGDVKFSTQPLPITADERLLPGDLLMCRTNGSISLIGKAAVVRSGLSTPHSFASYLLRFRFLDSTSLPLWVHTFVSSLPGRRFIERNAASSAGQHNISLSLIHRMPIPLAPVDEQVQILDEVEERLSVIAVAETEIGHGLLRAARLRQSILKQAFEGKLVPQDLTDEPACVLLERITGGTGDKMNGTNGAPRTRTRRNSSTKNHEEDRS